MLQAPPCAGASQRSERTISLFRTKPIDPLAARESGLHRCLNSLDVTLLGIGCIIGAGIFVFTGVAAATLAGPAIVLSFVVSGLACAFAALSYSELAAAIGGCGSAYGYAYAGLGELAAFIIGWDLILEYGVATAAVAIGWTGYFLNALTAMGVQLPVELTKGPLEGGWINLPAVMIILILGGLHALGVHVGARVNAAIVFIKLLVIGIFIAIAVQHVQPANWSPFMPFGWHGVMGGAALIFFAYIGFDAVSTAAEETTDPQRQMPIGILASLGICTVLYIVVSGLLTGIVPYKTLNTASPVADALTHVGHAWTGAVVAAGAIAGLTTVMLVLYYGLTRVFLAMSRDGLLPPVFSRLHERSKAPVRVILVAGVIMAAIAGFTPIGDVAELVNIGTLAAFVIVCAGVIILRRTRPDLHRPFRTPWTPWIPLLGIVFCLYLMASLPLVTWIRFFVWLAIGLTIYFSYSRANSALADTAAVGDSRR